VPGRRAADHEDMNTAQKIAGWVVAVIVVNLLIRVIPWPEIDLSSIPFPDLPDWLGTVLKVKNLVVIGIVIAIVVTAVVEEQRKKAR
jgi:uncharacterized membrane protein YqhA